MSTRCEAPIPWETLVAYWASDLSEAEALGLEEHVMGCAACSEASARVAQLTEGFRSLIRPIITHAEQELLKLRGQHLVDNPMRPGERREVLFPRAADVLVHRLTGLDLSRAARVSFSLTSESSGHVLIELDDAPFDRESGEVLVPCQKHYASMPPDTVARVCVHEADGRVHESTYTILHVME